MIGPERQIPERCFAWYVVTWHESDGNDCTVFDTVVYGADEYNAECRVGRAIENHLIEENVDFEPDGSELGGYFNGCDCDEPDYCDGHGGIVGLGVEGPFNSERDAEAACALYHVRWELPACRRVRGGS